jgi:hypothetical protein
MYYNSAKCAHNVWRLLIRSIYMNCYLEGINKYLVFSVSKNPYLNIHVSYVATVLFTLFRERKSQLIPYFS